MIDQIGIALTGVTAIFLTQSKHQDLQRFACVFGMAGQPFWIYSAWHAGQWGILALTSLYTLAWGKGLWTHWVKDRCYFMRLPGPQWHMGFWAFGLHCYGWFHWGVSFRRRYWSTR